MLEDSRQSLQYYFGGVIHPERADVHYTGVSDINLTSIQGNANGTLDISIRYSQISAIYKTSAIVEDLDMLRLALQEVIASLVDALGFYLTCGYTVELIQVSYVDMNTGASIHKVFGVQGGFAVDDENTRAYESQDTFRQRLTNSANQLFMLTNGDGGLFIRLALSDLRMAILSNSQSPFYCYRAIETLRQHCFEGECDSGNEKAQWDSFWAYISCPADIRLKYQELIHPIAKRLRHGKPLDRDFNRHELLQITWQITQLYFEAVTAST